MGGLRQQGLLTVALVALCMAAAGAGCGGGGSAELSTTSMSKAEFAGRVDAICSQGRRDALTYRPIGARETEAEAIAAAIETTVLPSIAETIDAIYELGAPAGEKKQTEALLVALQRAVDRGEELGAPTIERIEAIFRPSSLLAREAGHFACAYG